MARSVTNIRIDDDLREKLEARGGLSPIIHRDLGRLYDMYRRGLKEAALTVDEACLIVDALNGSIYDAMSIPFLPVGIAHAVQYDGLDEKWGVDGKALVEKLQPLSIIHLFAIIDATERFWEANEGDEQTRDIRERVAEYFGINARA